MRIHCPGCGHAIDAGDDQGVMTKRETARMTAPGRATIYVDDEIAHQCAPGTYVEPSALAEPRATA